jgi:hypothetical protein
MDGGVRRVDGDVRPAARRSVLNYGTATALRQRGFVCTRWAVVRVQEAPTRAPPASTRPAHAPLRGRALLLLGCVARQPATACGVGVHLGGHGGGERLRGQNEPADPSDDGLGASGGRVGGDGGWGARAAGRTSTGPTSAISASKRGSSGAQASPLYIKRPIADTSADSFRLLCSKRP